MISRIPFFIVFCIVAANLMAQSSDPLHYSQMISARHLKAYAEVLTSDSLEGRETTTQGQKKAAQFIRNHFSGLGIEPLPQLRDGYFQDFPLLVTGAGKVLVVSGRKPLRLIDDFYYMPGICGSRIKSNNIHFVGYGISDSAYNDFMDFDIKGKVVFLFAGEPKNPEGKSLITGSGNMSEWTSRWRKKIQHIRSKRPAAFFIVLDSIQKHAEDARHAIESQQMKLFSADQEKCVEAPYFYVSSEVADQWMKGKGWSVKKMKEYISVHGSHPPVTFNIPISVNIEKESRRAMAENVLGYIKGSEHPEELVVITAHYDHLGQSGEKIYRGADDDASGTSAVLELARVFSKAAQEGMRPRRSILFMPVSGEEKGLLGSDYYTKNPVFPLESTVANLNIDMIGRRDENHADDSNYVYVIGSDKISTDLHRLSEEVNAKYARMNLDYTFNDPNDPNRFYYRSDHYNFAKNNIPVIFYFNGVHADYHQPSDTPDKLEYNKMQKICRLVFHTAWEIANRDSRIMPDKR